MNTETGQIVPPQALEAMGHEERKKYVRVVRDLTVKEAFQKRVQLYSPCVCGSGKKFKFCCHKKS